jgi:hypothetical protein
MQGTANRMLFEANGLAKAMLCRFVLFVIYIISTCIERVSIQQRHDLELVWRQRWIFGGSCAAERKEQMVARAQQVLVTGNAVVYVFVSFALHFFA